jgi:hypothetical protein
MTKFTVFFASGSKGKEVRADGNGSFFTSRLLVSGRNGFERSVSKPAHC